MEPRLSILTFPQRFDGGTLRLRILIVPRLSAAWNGDPLLPMIEGFPDAGDTAPPFADADLRLEVRVIDGLERFPDSAPADFTAPLPQASGVMPDARALFEELIAPGPGRFQLSADPPRLAEPPRAEIFVKAYLPHSYREAFAFTGPQSPNAVIDDSYHCAFKKRRAWNPAFRVTPDSVSWGQIYAYCLRHPLLAQQLGLIRTATFAVEPGLLEAGGFVYVDLAGDSAYAIQAAADYTFLKRHAARVPRLEVGVERPLFAAVQFPVLLDDPTVPGPPAAPGNYDAVFIEAAAYDDGFARIVHGMQPVSQDFLAEDPDGFPPLTDLGIRLAWDNEKVLEWQNRQLQEDPTASQVPGQPRRLDAPLGVFGYRVDARELGEADWHSLVRVRSRTPLTIGTIPLGGPGELAEGELGVEVHPAQLDGDQDAGQFWLPMYMAQWNGTSLVLPDEVGAALYRTEEATGGAASLGRIYEPVGLEDIPLRYGRTYQLRVRLMDLTGGGPDVTAAPVHDSPAPIATIPFRRRVVPEPVHVAGLPRVPDVEVDALFAGDSLEVTRPLLGYPSVVFTGKYAAPIPLLQAASAAATGEESFGIPDPDVQRVRVDVEVRTLRMDNLRSLSGREPYVHLYTTERDFPADVMQPSAIPLEFRDAAVLRFQDPNDLGDLGVTQAELDAMSQLVLPTARDIRITLRAVADEDAAYFAPGAHLGKPIQVQVRRAATRELGVIAATGAAAQIRGIYLQPDPPPRFGGTVSELLFQRGTGHTPSIIERLAQQLGTEHKGLTLVGRKGERVVFAASRRIRHTLAPDGSSLTFAAKEDLINHWLVALTLQLDRDWTWDGLQPVSFEIFRRKRFGAEADVDDNGGRPVGDWELHRAVSMQALQDPRRDHTTLVFVDAVEPLPDQDPAGPPAADRLPEIIELDYRVEPRFRTAPAEIDPPRELHLTLPVTTPPVQVPRIASAGIALSRYERDETYSRTGARQRFLWLELEQPVHDPRDELFVRVLGYAPDPLLSDNRIETFLAPEESPLAIDPELIRVISPGQPDDGAGLSAMVQAQRAGNSDRHFLVPLPPGLTTDSPELFGFFTYELRIGHARVWSTAQGRFGRALRSTGVQHPAPTLFCTCQRDERELVVEAPYAQAVLGGKNLTADPPRTELWALLYAQVRQADGKDHRNVLLDDQALHVLPRARRQLLDPSGQVSMAFQNRGAVARGATRWTQDQIARALRELGLPADSSLSVLCVEMMPSLAALRGRPAMARSDASTDLAARVHAERAGRSTPPDTAPEEEVRPLSDCLGHYRILRTSPLTPAPRVCHRT